MVTANRGKVAEALVKKYLGKLSEVANAAFMRLPDARAGSFQPTLADFIFMQEGRTYLVEVKETQHDYRLPHANFSVDQVARMRAFEAAGAYSVVLIYHSTSKRWRTLPISYFLNRTGGSWDLRDQPETLTCSLF